MHDPRSPRTPPPPRPMYREDEEYGYDDGPRWPPPPPPGDDGNGGFEADRNLVRVAAVIVALAAVIIILIVPPISILDRGNGSSTASGGVVVDARGSMPELPEGLEAASALYDIEADESLTGARTLTVRLSAQTNDATNLAFYTHADGNWERLAAVQPVDGGRAASGEVPSVPANIAVLRRTSFPRTLGIVLQPGEAADPAAPAGGVVSVLAAMPAGGGEEVELSDRLPGGLSEQYLGVSTGTAAEAAAVNRILGDPVAIRRHVDSIVSAAETANASGVHIDYTAVDPARRAAFTSFIEQLAARLRDTNRGIVVTVATPPAPNDPGGYDWVPLAAVVDALWLRAPADPAAFYQLLEPALQAKRDSGFDLGRVALLVDRSSRERSNEGISTLSLLDALTRASAVQARIERGITPGQAVTLVATRLDQSAGNSGLHWDDGARSVTFTYTDRSDERTVWVENRFSMAFRLDLAHRYELGGVVVASATDDEVHPEVWDLVSQYLEDGHVRLETPFGPYLRPQWTASGGEIELGPNDGVAIWNAPMQLGINEVTLLVSDGVVFVGQNVSLRVAEEQREPTPTPVTETPTPSPSPTASATPTETMTPDPTETATETSTVPPTVTETATDTPTATSTPEE